MGNDVGKHAFSSLLKYFLQARQSGERPHVVWISTTNASNQQCSLEGMAAFSCGSTGVYQSVTDIHVKTQDGRLVVIGEMKSAKDAKRGIAGEGQLASHMALALGSGKTDHVLGFTASPTEMVLYKGYTEDVQIIIEKIYNFGKPTKDNILLFMRSIFIVLNCDD
jgi:hypothetical protein